jgi:hypothetical protein
MSTTEINSIDEKKQQTTTEKNVDLKGFFVSYTVSIIFTIGIIIFIIGTLGLYTTKVAQSNILPDNINLTPFTDIERVVKGVPIDINIVYKSMFSTDDNICYSQKAFFNSRDYLNTFKKSFLCYLFKNSNPESGFFSNFTLFLSKVLTDIYALNYNIITIVFGYLSYLPESLIMILYGFLGIFLWIFLYFINFCLSLFYHITNIPQLFKTSNDSGEWQADNEISFSVIKFILFWFLWLPIGFVSSLIVPIYTTFATLISPLYAKYSIQQNGNYTETKLNTVFDFLLSTLYFKKTMFFMLATISLASNANSYLGTASLIGVLVATIIAYFIGLYSVPNYMEDPLNQLSKGLANKKPILAKISKGEKIHICKAIKEKRVLNEIEGEFQSGGKKYNIKLV